MASGPQRWEFWRHAIGVVACITLGWFGVVEGIRVPLLADATFGFHEFGHLVTWFLPDTYRALMGPLFQVLVPVGLAAYFLLFHRDLLGVALTLTWAGVSCADASVYIADAPLATMQLSPGHVTHDWAFALGPGGLDRVAAADELAAIVYGVGLACVIVAMGVAAWGAVKALLERPSVERAAVFLERQEDVRDAEGGEHRDPDAAPRAPWSSPVT